MIAAVAARVGDMLADERLDRRGRDLEDLDAAGERDFARRCARVELGDAASDAEVEAVVARVLGLGRLQPLLEDPEVNDVHVRGAEPVWVKLRDGRRERRPPVVDHDDEALMDELAAGLDPTDARALCAAPLPLARRAVRRWLTAEYPPDLATVDRVLDVAHGRATACHVAGGREVRRRAQRLAIVPLTRP